MDVINIDEIVGGMQKSLGSGIDSNLADRIKSSKKYGSSNLGSANCASGSVIFYITFNIQFDGYTFQGEAGGIGLPGGSASWGSVYGDSVSDIVNNTVSFWATGALTYCNVIFFDSDSNVLGPYQGGALGDWIGSCGGSGSWTSN